MIQGIAHTYAASPKKRRILGINIGTLPNDECKKKIIEMINLIPNLFTLLYNFILYDFDTPDTDPFPSYTGSRTTGKIVKVNDSIDTHRHLKGDTFIQRGIKEAIQNLESMKQKKKGFKQFNVFVKKMILKFHSKR